MSDLPDDSDDPSRHQLDGASLDGAALDCEDFEAWQVGSTATG